MFVIKDLIYKNILHIKKLEIPTRTVTCLVGESGAGKSTLLKMLNMMISPDSGTVFYNGTNLLEEDAIEVRRRFVMLPQQPTIFDGSIRENLNIGLLFSEKEAKDDKDLLGAMETVHLNKDLEEDATTLSGGEKQRLALARVYLMQPEVYLLDEPTAALDGETEEVVMESFLKNIREKTVIMITHSQKMAEKYGENIVVLEKRLESTNE